MRDDEKRYDPMAPENLPKGMKLPQQGRVSQVDRNYVSDIVNKIKEIDDLDIEVLRLDTSEDSEQNPLVTLVLEVKPKGGDEE